MDKTQKFIISVATIISTALITLGINGLIADLVISIAGFGNTEVVKIILAVPYFIVMFTLGNKLTKWWEEE